MIFVIATPFEGRSSLTLFPMMCEPGWREKMGNDCPFSSLLVLIPSDIQNWFAWRDVFFPNIVFWGESFFQSVLKHSQPFYSIFNSKVSGWGGCSWVSNIQTCDCVDPLVPGERGTVMTGVWRRGARCSVLHSWPPWFPFGTPKGFRMFFLILQESVRY